MVGLGWVGGVEMEGTTHVNNTILLSAVLNPNSQPLQDEKSNDGMLESLGQYSFQRVYSMTFD